MKKFNVKNNIAVVVSEGFKDSVRFAVEHTSNEHNAYGRTRYDKSFIGTIVTFNPSTQEVECFSVNEFVNSSENQSEILSVMYDKINEISRTEKHFKNEIIAVVYASDFEYYSHIGYPSKEEQENRALKIDNKFMSLYIDIIGRANNDYIKDLALSVRTLNCLQRAGLETIQDVKKLSFDEVCKIRNLGRTSVEELERVLDIKFV